MHLQRGRKKKCKQNSEPFVNSLCIRKLLLLVVLSFSQYKMRALLEQSHIKKVCNYFFLFSGESVTALKFIFLRKGKARYLV
jgi:hypothetical protein